MLVLAPCKLMYSTKRQFIQQFCSAQAGNVGFELVEEGSGKRGRAAYRFINNFFFEMKPTGHLI
jgi:hypothetical protein